MTGKLVGIQIVRFGPVPVAGRPHWRIGGYRPETGTLGLHWLGTDGWLPARAENEPHCRRFGTQAAARRALATL